LFLSFKLSNIYIFRRYVMKKQAVLAVALALGLLLLVLVVVPGLAQEPTGEPRPQIEPSEVEA
jgi:hypothetical protein